MVDGTQPPPRHFNARFIVTSFRRHVLVFLAAAAAMTAVDMRNPDDAWALWPVMVWALVVAFHFMAMKLLTVDEGWADERVGELFYKAYDASHIKDIKVSPGRAAAARRKRKPTEPPVDKPV